jgi:hypothetical protein
LTGPQLAAAEAITPTEGKAFTYGRWETVHEHREVGAEWFERNALLKLSEAARAAGRHIDARTLRLLAVDGYRFVLRGDGPIRAKNGSSLGRWEPCPVDDAEVLYRSYRVKLR